LSGGRPNVKRHAIGVLTQTQCWQVGFSSILEEDFGAPEFFSDEIFRPGDKKVNYNNIRSATCSVFVVPTSPWLREGGHGVAAQFRALGQRGKSGVYLNGINRGNLIQCLFGGRRFMMLPLVKKAASCVTLMWSST
jgi:hypothetical protein